jgi:hypothetical protein
MEDPQNRPQQVGDGARVEHLRYRARPIQPHDTGVELNTRADPRLDKAVSNKKH